MCTCTCVRLPGDCTSVCSYLLLCIFNSRYGQWLRHETCHPLFNGTCSIMLQLIPFVNYSWFHVFNWTGSACVLGLNPGRGGGCWEHGPCAEERQLGLKCRVKSIDLFLMIESDKCQTLNLICGLYVNPWL